MEKTIKTAIVGYGKSAKFFHVPLLKAAKGFEVRSVLQRTKNDSQTEFPDAKLVRDMKDLLKDDQLELVVITSPNHVHFEQASEALNADKHVVVEKPFTVTSEEAEKLIRLAENKKRVLTVFQNRRWDGDFLTLKEVIKSGKLGTLVEFESTYNRFRNELRDDAWKEKELPGSGILYDLSPHLIDQVLLLFGTPEKVYADIHAQRGGDTDDRFDLNLFYPNMKVILRAGMLVPEDTPRFILRGTKGSFVKFGIDPQEAAMAEGRIPGDSNWGKESPDNRGILYLEEDGKIRTEKVETLPGNYPAFYDKLEYAIQKKWHPPVMPETAKNVIKIIEKTIESSAEKRAVDF